MKQLDKRSLQLERQDMNVDTSVRSLFTVGGDIYTLITEQTRGVSVIEWGKGGVGHSFNCVLTLEDATKVVGMVREAYASGESAGREQIKTEFRTLMEIKKL